MTIHEMVQSPDGRIGTKWIEEIIPATQKERSLAKEIKAASTFATGSSSFLLTFDVETGTDLAGKLGALFLGADGENDLLFSLPNLQPIWYSPLMMKNEGVYFPMSKGFSLSTFNNYPTCV